MQHFESVRTRKARLSPHLPPPPVNLGKAPPKSKKRRSSRRENPSQEAEIICPLRCAGNGGCQSQSGGIHEVEDTFDEMGKFMMLPDIRSL
jgi:hypothetical protein